jgi:hypothetical protein
VHATILSRTTGAMRPRIKAALSAAPKFLYRALSKHIVQRKHEGGHRENTGIGGSAPAGGTIDEQRATD